MIEKTEWLWGHKQKSAHYRNLINRNYLEKEVYHHWSLIGRCAVRTAAQKQDHWKKEIWGDKYESIYIQHLCYCKLFHCYCYNNSNHHVYL